MRREYLYLQDIGDKELPGLDEASYHLVAGERLNERISQSWNRLLGVWKAFRAAANTLPASDTGTTLTRERWLLACWWMPVPPSNGSI
jgi:hypothetical protein